MSASTQRPLQGAQTDAEAANQTDEKLHDVPKILWNVGADDEFDTTEAEMAEVMRRCQDRGLIEGGDGR